MGKKHEAKDEAYSLLTRIEGHPWSLCYRKIRPGRFHIRYMSAREEERLRQCCRRSLKRRAAKLMAKPEKITIISGPVAGQRRDTLLGQEGLFVKRLDNDIIVGLVRKIIDLDANSITLDLGGEQGFLFAKSRDFWHSICDIDIKEKKNTKHGKKRS